MIYWKDEARAFLAPGYRVDGGNFHLFEPGAGRGFSSGSRQLSLF